MMKNQNFGDKEMLTDVLASQKYITDGYNTSANESMTPALRCDFVNILNEEHQIQSEVFTEMHNRGWYPVEAADQNKITQARQKYSSMQ